MGSFLVNLTGLVRASTPLALGIFAAQIIYEVIEKTDRASVTLTTNGIQLDCEKKTYLKGERYR